MCAVLVLLSWRYNALCVLACQQSLTISHAFAAVAKVCRHLIVFSFYIFLLLIIGLSFSYVYDKDVIAGANMMWLTFLKITFFVIFLF